MCKEESMLDLVKALPEYQKSVLFDFALELTRNVFSRPGEEERYQKWLAERQSKIANSK